MTHLAQLQEREAGQWVAGGQVVAVVGLGKELEEREVGGVAGIVKKQTRLMMKRKCPAKKKKRK